MSCLIAFLIFVLVVVVVGWIVTTGLGLMGVAIPGNIQKALALILALIALLMLLDCLVGSGSWRGLCLFRSCT